ncbi:acyltransferase family protein [Pseudonocardia lacus]|uniref:acyltransferase family protein n=1 Tax=Pseudonocardia lacus TaxID=2835865 RepID=UPI001BDBCAF6|nr:acyltransferase family protein [Pseudonocardia lacus]
MNAPLNGSTTTATHRASERRYRPELQGLRGLAVALVVVYHVWLNRVSGGVDVFFLVSGFLLTAQLVRAAEGGALHVRRRWGRTVLRIGPAALVVLLSVGLAGATLLPEGRWGQTIRELLASALFVQNWQLAADAVDYGARNNIASVVQHFWSLSVQVQFFVAWPLLIALVLLTVRAQPHRLHGRLTLTVLGVFVASLSYSVALTDSDQVLAYFDTLTRLWEFALGGLLALWIDRVVLSRAVRVAMGWIGVVGLLLCGIVLNVGSMFPGYAALWPTVCAGLVLLAGHSGSPLGADRLLSARPMRYLGDISFALYLWHWPLLVLYLVTRDREEVGALGGTAIIALSLVLAVLTYHLVEKPVLAGAKGVPAAGRRFAAAGLVAVLLVAGGWQVALAERAQQPGAVGDAFHPGALALVGADASPAPLLPAPVTVYEDWVRIEYWDCAPLAQFPMDRCTQPVEGEPERRIVVVGDSHVQQLTGALLPVAQQRNWQVTAIVRGACPFSTVSEVVPDELDCLNWGEAAAAEIAELNPDAVVTLASRDVRAGLTEQTPPGFVERWRQLDDLGIPVLAVRDNPRFDYSVPDCVQTDGADCGADREAVYAAVPPYAQLDDVPANVSFLDIADAVCDAARCPAVIGNVLVYLDDNHLTASYTTSMSGLLEEQIVAALGGV